MPILDVAITCFNIIVQVVIIFAMWFVITGVLIGILQTIFSVQDQSLPIVSKLIVLIFLIANQGSEILEQFNHILSTII